MADGAIQDIAHEVKACVLCQACASILCERALGADAAALDTVRETMTAMLKQGASAPPGVWQVLEVFEPVSEHKGRHACVLLPFEAVGEALNMANDG